MEKPLLHKDVVLAVPPGWVKLVRRTLAALEKIKKAECPSLEVVSIKEKFAGLRIYIRTECARAKEVIASATREAALTCQECSGKEEVMPSNCDGWYKNLCKTCASPKKKKRS